MEYFGGEIMDYDSSGLENIEQFIAKFNDERIFLHDEDGIFHEKTTMERLLSNAVIRPPMSSRNCIYLPYYTLYTEDQIMANSTFYSGRSPSDRNCLGFGYNCGFFGYGTRGYAFSYCIGYCGSPICARVIQLKSMKIIMCFLRNIVVKQRHKRKRAATLVFRKAIMNNIRKAAMDDIELPTNSIRLNRFISARFFSPNGQENPIFVMKVLQFL